MKRYTTKGTVLNRTDFGEADRILTFLTDDRGKIRAIAKGVRKSKAKLAGSIELFSISDLTLIVGRSELDTLISARLVKHYGNIVKNIERTTLAYNFMKIINKSTEDRAEPEYFELLNKSFSALDDSDIVPQLTQLWFQMHLLKLAGHTPNLQTDEAGVKLLENQKYNFNYDKMCFTRSKDGSYGSDEIKFLRLGFDATRPITLNRLTDSPDRLNILYNECELILANIFSSTRV